MSIGAITSTAAYQRPSSSISARSVETSASETGTATDAGAGGGQVAETASGQDGKASGLFISPVLRYDQSARVAVLLFRDFDTGETRDQIPAEKVVKQYRQTGGPPQTDSSESGAETNGAGYEASRQGAGPTSGGTSFGGESGRVSGSAYAAVQTPSSYSAPSYSAPSYSTVAQTPAASVSVGTGTAVTATSAQPAATSISISV